MSKHAQRPAPRHRGAPAHAHIAEAPRKMARTVVLLSSVAAAVTGVSVAGGLLGQQGTDGEDSEIVALRQAGASADLTDLPRREVVSRGDDRRLEQDPVKASALIDSTAGSAMTDKRELSDSDPRDIARALLGEFGFGSDQFGCLDRLWTRESNWRWNADNPTSSAYGIPQALPGRKMASAGADWATNPATQIRWGLGYIDARYGSPCSAWGHSQARGWY